VNIIDKMASRDSIIHKISSELRKFFIRHKISPWFDKQYDRYISVRRDYQARNAKRLKRYNQKWHRKHAVVVAERKHLWYLEHQDEVREYQRQWYAKRKADRYTNQSVTEGKGDENAN